MAQPCIQCDSPADAAAHPDPIDDQLDPRLFKALADPTRARLFACLIKCGRACSISELSECCEVDYSVVSRHLAHLASAGLIETSKQGRTVLCLARTERIIETLRDLALAMERWCVTPSSCCAPAGGR